MSFLIKCTNCGNEQELKENDSWSGNQIEIKPSSWGGSLYLELECKNSKCKESINLN
jgi:hypothetical protein